MPLRLDRRPLQVGEAPLEIADLLVEDAPAGVQLHAEALQSFGRRRQGRLVASRVRPRLEFLGLLPCGGQLSAQLFVLLAQRFGGRVRLPAHLPHLGHQPDDLRALVPQQRLLAGDLFALVGLRDGRLLLFAQPFLPPGRQALLVLVQTLAESAQISGEAGRFPTPDLQRLSRRRALLLRGPDGGGGRVPLFRQLRFDLSATLREGQVLLRDLPGGLLQLVHAGVHVALQDAQRLRLAVELFVAGGQLLLGLLRRGRGRLRQLVPQAQGQLRQVGARPLGVFQRGAVGLPDRTLFGGKVQREAEAADL